MNTARNAPSEVTLEPNLYLTSEFLFPADLRDTNLASFAKLLVPTNPHEWTVVVSSRSRE